MISSFNIVKNSLAPIVGSLKNVFVISTGTKRGNKNSINIPTNSIFIFTSGNAIVNNISGNNLNIVLEGGNPNWEGSLLQNKYDTYYPYYQRAMLSKIVDYLESYNPKIVIRYDL